MNVPNCARRACATLKNHRKCRQTSPNRPEVGSRKLHLFCRKFVSVILHFTVNSSLGVRTWKSIFDNAHPFFGFRSRPDFAIVSSNFDVFSLSRMLRARNCEHTSKMQGQFPKPARFRVRTVYFVKHKFDSI